MWHYIYSLYDEYIFFFLHQSLILEYMRVVICFIE